MDEQEEKYKRMLDTIMNPNIPLGNFPLEFLIADGAKSNAQIEIEGIIAYLNSELRKE